MKLQNFILITMLSFIPLTAFCQGLPIGTNVKFSSPQAASLGKYGGKAINYSTGTPDINIPLLTLKEGDLEIPVALSYTYSGFQPSNQASWAGLGFSLIPGGVITRTIKGLPDELSSQGYLTAPGKISSFVNQASFDAVSFINNDVKNLDDLSADAYTFQFNGYSGKFIIDNTGKGTVISDASIKISYEKGVDSFAGNNQIISKWTFITEDGTTYIFEKREYTETSLVFTLDVPYMRYLPSAWYLTQVTNKNGNQINLEYSTANINRPRLQYGRSDQYQIDVLAAGGENISQTGSITENKTLELYLTKIKGSNWELVFNSEEYSRLSDNNSSELFARQLNDIQLFNTSVTPSVKTKQFSFTYTTDLAYRLHLLSVKEDGANPHLFSYDSFASAGMVGRDANVDYWNYYNGVYNNSLLPVAGADLEPREGPTKMGALTRLTYPTKGYTDIAYEQNAYSYLRANVHNASRTTVKTQYFRRFWNTQGAFRDSSGISSLVIAQSTDVDVILYNNSNFPPKLPSEPQIPKCGNQGIVVRRTLAAGTYNMNEIMEIYGFQPCDRQDMHAMPGFDITMEFKTYEKVISNVHKYGGIRVKTMTDFDNTTGSSYVTSFSYQDATDPTLSSGVIGSIPYTELTFVNTVGSHTIYRSAPFNPEALSQLYYKYVTVSTADYITSYKYTSHAQQSDNRGKWAFLFDQGLPGPINSPAQEFTSSNFVEIGDYGSYYFMRSLPQEVVTKDKSGSLKKKNTYEYSGYDQNTLNIPSLHYELLASYVNYPDPSNNNPSTRMLYYGKAYYAVGGWPRKTSETVTNYESGTPVTVTTDYEYGTTHKQLSNQRTILSDGNIEETDYKYPLDYSTSTNTVIQNMISTNMVNYPLEQVTWLKKSATDRKVIDANTTTYSSFTGNTNRASLILPYKKFRFKGLNGSVATFAAYDGTSNENTSDSYRETMKFTHYDTQGNPLSLVINGGDKLSYLWAYNGQYAVAEIKNADNAAVASALASTTFSQMAEMTDSPTIQAKLDAVRLALPASLMTSYLYKPTVGITAITDPSGKNIVYEYDGYGRLKYIKDAAGKIRSSYCYNYAGQGVVCESGISTAGTIMPAALLLLADEDAPLPVKLVNFNSAKQEQTVLLSWNTADEINSDRFDVEHSMDGKKWSRIGSVSAKGESRNMQYYSFTDLSPLNGENLYRLKMVDLDGTFAYSRIRSQTFDSQISIFPNPLTEGDLLNLSVPDLTTISHLKIYDVQGKVVHSVKKPAGKIDVSALPAGVYIVQLTGTNGSVSAHRIVKQ